MTPKYYLKLGNKKFAAFYFFGIAGIILGIITTAILSFFTGLTISLYLFGLALNLAGALAAYAFQYIFTGSRELVVYRYLIILLLWNLAALWIFPIEQKLLILDHVVIGFGMFQSLGRIGCFHGGCCHGKPSHHGVHYSELHVSKGFPCSYAGLKIFPVQLIYSCCVLLLTIACILIALGNANPGTAFSTYLVLYGCCRFIMEFMRGDSIRPYFLKISEAQWTALITATIVCIAGSIELLPVNSVHVIVTVGMWLTASVIILTPTSTKLGKHIQPLIAGKNLELLHCIEKLKNKKGELKHNRRVDTLNTSKGYVISMASVERQTFFTISNQRKKMRSSDVTELTDLILHTYYPLKKKSNLLKRTGNIIQLSVE